ncbi:MAG: DUF3791 domain-containing protein [Parabacteroides sp.]|nr:DUF3791 domain-containing protein [Parabacteroides sp.]MDY4757478.1 DUF3791 domain-containing protein [Parabacteroides sp.]
MNNNQQDIALFLSFCIEQYKAAKGMTGKEAMQELDRYGVLEYLSEFYDVLHTQGRQWILADIEDFISLHKQEEKQ